MKNGIKYLFSVFLAALMLLSATGITINKMICFSSGKTQVSLTAIQDCCDNTPMPPGTERLQDNCCDFSKTRIALDYKALVNKDLSQLTPDFTLFSPELPRFIPIVQNKFLSIFAGDLSPPPSGFELLKLLRVFLL